MVLLLPTENFHRRSGKNFILVGKKEDRDGKKSSVLKFVVIMRYKLQYYHNNDDDRRVVAYCNDHVQQQSTPINSQPCRPLPPSSMI